MTLYTGAHEVGWVYIPLSVQPSHAFASIAVNCNCLESGATGVGVSPKSLISAPSSFLIRAPRVDLACRFRMS